VSVKLFSTFLSITVLLSAFTFGGAFAATKVSPLMPVAENPSCHLTFGWTEWAPLQYLNSEGELQGLQVEFVSLIAKELGCRLVFVQGSWIDLINRLKQGEIDFISNATKTEQRSTYAYFSDAYREDVFTLYIRSKDLKNFAQSNIKDLKRDKFKLGLTRDFLYGEIIERWQKNPDNNQHLSYADSTEENASRLLAAEIDGFLEDPYVISYKLISQQLSQVSKTNITLFGHQSRFMFGKKKISPERVKRFNRALANVLKLQRFQGSWFAMEKD